MLLSTPRELYSTDNNSFTIYLEPGITYELTVNDPTAFDNPLEYNVYSFVVD